VSHTAENDAAAVPPCPKCGKPLGLYYMDCLWCYGHAGTYTYADYARVTPPVVTERVYLHQDWDKRVIPPDACEWCDLSREACQASRVKCCPDCKHRVTPPGVGNPS
jgi:hypothetical protein